MADLSQWQIRTPTGDDRAGLFQFLMEQFPPDRHLLQTVMDTGRGYSTWTPYVLYEGGRLLGNVSLMPLRIWLEGRTCEVAGVASVATDSSYRRLGVARRLMEHCLGIADRRGLPCVLFTSLPQVYRGVGFSEVAQRYVGAPADRLRFPARGFRCETLKALGESARETLASVYRDKCPDYTGKIERDPDYWEFYEILFHSQPHASILLCRRHETAVGYARCERETDRLLVPELCADPCQPEVAEALFARIADDARQAGLSWVTLAIPSDHFARRLLEDRGIALETEPPGAPRETFMVRPARGRPLGPLAALQWPLADKF